MVPCATGTMASSYDSSSEDDGPKAGRQFDREQSAFDLSGPRGASESTMLDSVISTNERNRERELQSRLEVMVSTDCARRLTSIIFFY